MKKGNEDMRIEPIEGAPISLNKLVNSEAIKNSPSDFKMLIDNSGSGFVNDTPHLANITIADREMQADYFLGLGLPMPPYLLKYLKIAYSTDKTEAEILALYEYAKTNKEMKQLIGFIQLFAGCCKHKMSAYIEEPETHLHPKRQASFMSMFHAIKDDYTPKPPLSPIPTFAPKV